MAGGPLDIDDVLEALRSERRRHALAVLAEHSTPLTLADLADEVAIREHAAPIDEIAAEDVQRVYLDLYHAHVPKLVELDVLEYHQEGDLVTPTENVGRVVAIMHDVHENGSETDTDRGAT